MSTDAPSPRRLLADAALAFGIGLPLCIAFGLISIPIGSVFFALIAIAWKGVFG